MRGGTEMKVVKIIFFFILAGWGGVAESPRPLKFGVIATVKPEIVQRHFAPLLHYLSRRLGRKVIFATGRDYDDTINKFIDGTFDLGYIGPSPYVLASRKAPESLRVIAGVENDHKPYFRAVIVTRKESGINRLGDLVGKKFAFGSYRSTLSYYLPAYMLYRGGILEKLRHYDFLGRHDIVAKNVIMGNYDAGGIKMRSPTPTAGISNGSPSASR